MNAVSPAEKKAESSEAEDDDQGRKPEIAGGIVDHGRAERRFRLPGRRGPCPASMPGAMKLCPMPRARMKVSAPPFTFLSCAMASSKSIDGAAAARHIVRGASAGRRPSRCASTRSASVAGAEPEEGGEAEGEGEADGDALAMDEPGGIVSRDALERVAEGVAEIEQRAVAVLALVAHHHGGLGAAALRHGLVALRAAGEDALPVGLAPVEEARVVDEAVFHHLRIAGAHLAQRQRVEQRRVGQHEARLMEGADEVLAVAAN